MRSSLSACLVALVCVGCGCGPRQAVRYGGSEAPRIALPGEIRELGSLPEGYDDLGRIDVTCTLRPNTGQRLKGAWLSDLDCSEARLRRALSERASEAGGEILVGVRCQGLPLHPSSDSGEIHQSCGGRVARPGDELLSQRPLAARDLREEGDPPASEAWRIRVEFTPRVAQASRPARLSSEVRELPEVPVSHVELGDVIARCKRGCSLRGVRDGVRLAAARLGASDVAGVHCVEQGAGFVCSGTAAAYEVEPALDPRAR